ncbi:enoyl-CoA hydratase/isomerase family protein [Azohydromonas caseinilytica]|uniref:Enoyl-CoA hydratase/isomerase family protein n=1 Tax=Azohydromonas caseinilytica TaxID=2728836 RepID=A0A848F953_9BURK|nr:enoyl-CoA hydratase/isomerase family protein [Azohydromonas caseinilytica]NML16667.1 enoyl-CoA hydratase/isomerase family protein [Azohydromonas caseinilytica]
MTSTSLLLVERFGPVARLTLNRPAQGNAMDAPLARTLLAAAIACDADASIRCVLLTGSGKLFCAGGDIGAFQQAGTALPALVMDITASLHAAVARLARMDKPLVTALNGAAAGAGLGLALMGDVVLAARSAHLTAAYTAIGLSPDAGASWWLPRLAGLRQAQDMILTNRRVRAEEARELGLVTRVVDDADLAQEAMAVATRLASYATQALGRSRRLLLQSFDTGLEAHLQAEAREIAAAATTPDGREGVRAFVERRAALFDTLSTAFTPGQA